MTTDNLQQSFLPDFCHFRAVIMVLVAGQLLAIILTLSYLHPDPVVLWQTLGLLSLFIHWLGLSSAVILCLSKKVLQISDSLVGMLSYLILLLNTLVFTLISLWAIEGFGPLQTQYGEVEPQQFVFHTLGIAAIIYALLLRYLYMHHQWQLQIRTEADTRFQMLQARIRPHFLFNTMNTIACLVHDTPDKAEAAIEDLSELLRTSLKEQQQFISLEQEFALCQHYLNIEQLRLGDRLQVEWNLSPINSLLPPLIIQPLVENAIYHGIEPSVAGGCLEISSTQEKKCLIINIKNPYINNPSEHHGHQIALDNIQQRLALAYKDKANLVIQQDSHFFQVTLTLPITESTCAS